MSGLENTTFSFSKGKKGGGGTNPLNNIPRNRTRGVHFGVKSGPGGKTSVALLSETRHEGKGKGV